jgi:hypothetical protein
MGSYGPLSDFIGWARQLPDKALDLMSGDTERRWLADKMGMPMLSPDRPSQPDTAWHDQQVQAANQSFQPKIHEMKKPLGK